MTNLTKEETIRLYNKYQWSKGFIFVFESAYKSFFAFKRLADNEAARKSYEESMRKELISSYGGMLADYTGTEANSVIEKFTQRLLAAYDAENGIGTLSETVYDGSFIEDLKPANSEINAVFQNMPKLKSALDEARKTYPYKTVTLGMLTNDDKNPVITALNFESIDLNFISGYWAALQKLQTRDSEFLYEEAQKYQRLGKLHEKIANLSAALVSLLSQGPEQLSLAASQYDKITTMGNIK